MQAVERVLTGVDAFLSAAPYYYNLDITQVAISFAPASGGSTIDEFVSVTDGRFSTDLQFSSAQVGNYELLVYGGQAGQSLTFLGNFSPVTVLVAQPDLVRQAE